MRVYPRHPRRVASLLPVVLVACSGPLLSCEGCGESPPASGDSGFVLADASIDGGVAALPPADPVAGQETATFSFLGQSDALSTALTDAYDAYVEAPTNESEMQQLFARQKSAMQYFAAHPDDSAQKVVDELADRSPVDERSWRIGYHLLGLFESQQGITFLYDQAAAPVPADPDPQDSAMSPAAVKSRLRRAAVHALGSVAVRGSANARSKLLDLVGVAGGIDLKAEAAKGFYAASPSRSKAKKLLEAKLGPEERYLVNEIF
ncbi:MAG: hypothetical protein ABIJ09_13165 [Pseudomonadota bacterium]